MRLFAALLVLTSIVSAQAVSAAAPKAPKLGVIIYEDDRDGVVVDEVRPDGVAASSGIRPGDRILKVGDVAVKNDEDLVKALQGLRVGRTTTIEVLRDGETKSLPVTFKARAARARDGDRADGVKKAREALARAETLLRQHAGIAEVREALVEIARARKALSAGERRTANVRGGMPDIQQVSARVQELLSSGATPDEIEETIAEEFPGVAIRIGGGLGGEEEMPPPPTIPEGGASKVMVRCGQCSTDPEPCESCKKRAADMMKSREKGQDARKAGKGVWKPKKDGKKPGGGSLEKKPGKVTKKGGQ